MSTATGGYFPNQSLLGCGWRKLALRWFSLCGIITPVVDICVDGVVASLQPMYNPIRDYVSTEASPGHPYAIVVRCIWMSFPVFFGPFALAVYAAIKDYRLGWVTPTLLFLFSLGIAGCGIFRWEPYHPTSFSARAHLISSTFSTAALFPCPFFFWLSTRHDGRWRWYGHYSLFIQLVGLCGAITLALAFLHLVWARGICERAYWVIYYFWVLLIGLTLRRAGKAPGGTLEPPPASA